MDTAERRCRPDVVQAFGIGVFYDVAQRYGIGVYYNVVRIFIFYGIGNAASYGQISGSIIISIRPIQISIMNTN